MMLKDGDVGRESIAGLQDSWWRREYGGERRNHLGYSEFIWQLPTISKRKTSIGDGLGRQGDEREGGEGGEATHA
jgi:hypothetical protein